jgi:hypothetical protein
MAYKGKYQPTNPNKYRGDPSNIIFRSLWERRVMVEFDTNPDVLEWASEEMHVPYRSPIDGKWHRYFPDFVVKMRDRGGSVRMKMIEIKPLAQTRPPPPHEGKKRPTKAYLTEVMRYGINSAKWKAAQEYCADRGWDFVIITEKELRLR